MPEDRQVLVAELGKAIQAYQRATDGFDDAVGRHLGLNPTDLRCLDWLTEGAMTVGELAGATGLSSAAATTMLDRLEEKGFLQRERDTLDRRRVLIELTRHGREQLHALYGPLAEEGGWLLSGFDDGELERMRDFLFRATGVVERHETLLRTSGG